MAVMVINKQIKFKSNELIQLSIVENRVSESSEILLGKKCSLDPHRYATTVKLDYNNLGYNRYNLLVTTLIRCKRQGLSTKVIDWDQNVSFYLFVKTSRTRYPRTSLSNESGRK